MLWEICFAAPWLNLGGSIAGRLSQWPKFFSLYPYNHMKIVSPIHRMCMNNLLGMGLELTSTITVLLWAPYVPCLGAFQMIQNPGTVTKMRKAWAMTSEAIGSDLKLIKDSWLWWHWLKSIRLTSYIQTLSRSWNDPCSLQRQVF